MKATLLVLLCVQAWPSLSTFGHPEVHRGQGGSGPVRHVKRVFGSDAP